MSGTVLTPSRRRFHSGLPVTEEAYEWGRRELERRDREIREARSYADLLRLKREWDRRADAFSISSHVTKQVINAALDEQDAPWRRAG